MTLISLSSDQNVGQSLLVKTKFAQYQVQLVFNILDIRANFVTYCVKHFGSNHLQALVDMGLELSLLDHVSAIVFIDSAL